MTAVVPAVDALDRRFEAVIVAGARLGRGIDAAAARSSLPVVLVPAEARAVASALDALRDSGIDRQGIVVLDTTGALEEGCDDVTVVRVDDVRAVVAEQLLRRSRGELPLVDPPATWRYDVLGVDPEQERVAGALLAVGDGVVGVTGAPLTGDGAIRRTALVAGVYDGQDASTHLLSAPVTLSVDLDRSEAAAVRRVLDLRRGLLREEEQTGAGQLVAVRFAALARPGTVVLRAQVAGGLPPPRLVVPDPAREVDEGEVDGTSWARVPASTGGVVTAVHTSPVDATTSDVVAVYEGDPDVLPSPGGAVAGVAEAVAAGFDRLLAEQRRAWARRWATADVVVPGDADLQRSTRLMLFHLMASVGDRGEAAVGARGLTGHGYSGHVFWDADAFVLPFFAATHPSAARAMLEYRVRRLPAALAAAQASGRAGARFPWESARTGEDVTPPTAYDRAGRLIEVRTGPYEEHIVADVAWAASTYVDWSGDDRFARGDGLRLLVETARWWASRAEVDNDGTAHLRGVIGPDEYHEDVDDNAYTNGLARWNLRRAVAAVEALPTSRRPAAAGELAGWRHLAEALVDGYDPATGRHEQFAGFDRLEPLVIAEVAPRRPIAADVLMGRDRIRGTQVVKQADVLMLHHLVPDELPPTSLLADLTYYEPRTAHGSSLSPGVHAALLARAGRLDAAVEALEITSHVDTLDLTGTTAAGVHLATAGTLWQAIVMGFAGCRPRGGRLTVDPHVPTSWGQLEVRLQFRGTPVRLRCSADGVDVHAASLVPVLVRGEPAVAGPRGLEPDRGEDSTT